MRIAGVRRKPKVTYKELLEKIKDFKKTFTDMQPTILLLTKQELDELNYYLIENETSSIEPLKPGSKIAGLIVMMDEEE